MSQNVQVGGTTYSIPDQGDPPNWGTNLTPFFVALAAEVATAPAFYQGVAVNSTPITIGTEQTYLVASNSITATLNLPTPVQNLWFAVKDSGKNAAVNNITIHRHGSEQINGVAADKVLSLSGGFWMFGCDGTNWFMLRDVEALNPLKSTNQLVITPGNGNAVTNSYTAPAADRVYTIPDAGASCSYVMGAGAQTIAGVKTFSSGVIISATSAHLTLATSSFNGIIQASAQATADRTFSIPDISGNGTFAMLQGTQTFSGSKTFSSAVAITATSNHLVLSTASNTLTVSANAQASSARTWSIPDISGNGTFVALEGTQTFTGVKTSTAQFKFQSGLDSAGSILIGADSAGTSITNSTNKRGQIAVPHYTSASQADVCLVSVLNTSSDNGINFGGGSTTLTAATSLSFYTAATATNTSGGTKRFGLATDGVATFTTTSTTVTPNYKVTIADDAVAALTSLVIAGSINTIIVMRQSDTSWSGMVQNRMGGTPTIVKIGGGANFDTSTSVLGGTTGVDGHVTISSQSNAIQLENRSGSSSEFYIFIFSGG